ncbi:MAG: ATP-binding protein [Candidatus Hydrogenedentes bacterium]|nr:ATP-binding protein [Candidatus Hydrogenedentota bacterium]
MRHHPRTRARPLTDQQRRDLFEIVEGRYDLKATLIAAQLPASHWHEAIGEPTLADAILDRRIHNAYTITLKGESMRKTRAKNWTLPQTDAKN